MRMWYSNSDASAIPQTTGRNSKSRVHPALNSPILRILVRRAWKDGENCRNLRRREMDRAMFFDEYARSARAKSNATLVTLEVPCGDRDPPCCMARRRRARKFRLVGRANSSFAAIAGNGVGVTESASELGVAFECDAALECVDRLGACSVSGARQ